MFNLEKSIFGWREQMLAAGIKTPVPLEELENHLREEIEQQIKLGLNEQEAFKASVQKIGQARAVQNEFKKVETTREVIRFAVNNLGIVLMLIGFWGLGFALIILAQLDELRQQSRRRRALFLFSLCTAAGALNLIWFLQNGGTLAHFFARKPLEMPFWAMIVATWLAFLIGHFRQWRKNRSFTLTLT
jgi:hypothetical protein